LHIAEKADIANTIGDTFSNNSSVHQYSTKLNQYRESAEKEHLNFKSNNTEVYNVILSLSKLITAINNSTDYAVCPDDIHYQVLKHYRKLPCRLSSQLETFLLYGVMLFLYQKKRFPKTKKYY